MVAINSNDAEAYPEDSFEAMVARAKTKDYAFPYLWDEDQRVARALGAVCTPDFFLYGSHRHLAYRGRLDDNWKEPDRVKRPELRAAIEAMLKNHAPEAIQHPSVGCSIKWKAKH